MIGIDDDASRFTESLYAERRVRSHDFDRFLFGLAVGIDLELHWHAEEIKILRNLSDNTKALVVAQPINRVLGLEFRSASRIQPLGKEPG